MSFGIDKKINKRHEFYAKTQSRLSDNFSTYNYSFLDVGLSTGITKGIKFDFSYVYNTRRRYSGENFTFHGRHQVYANLTFRKNFGDFRVVNRNQVQTDLEDGNFTHSFQRGTDYFYRNKTTIIIQEIQKIRTVCLL